jgi:hypothetical protein
MAYILDPFALDTIPPLESALGSIFVRYRDRHLTMDRWFGQVVAANPYIFTLYDPLLDVPDSRKGVILDGDLW